MPKVPQTSPATGLPTSSSYIYTLDCHFVDSAGRTLLLRGVNLSGASKAPVGHLSYLLEDFWDSAEAGGESFVGRPLNIDDGSADVHLARLRGWGFNMLRFPFTWEAIEHAGPKKYDYEFIDYTIRVLQKCKDYGFRVYLDPHQDTWSRFSGGSGAPYWTLAACGINPKHITDTQAAIIHCEYPLAHAPDPAALPAMIWSTNYGRLFSQTVFTLFFAGRDFAPDCIIDGVNIQDYLQDHYIGACGVLADRIREYDNGSLLDDCIIGWDNMNEPFEGLCGWDDLNTIPARQGSTLKKGPSPTPAQGLRLGMGKAQTVDHWTFGMFGPSRDGTVTIDPKGRKLWSDGEEEVDGVHPKWGWKRDTTKWTLGTCIWAQHGVWDIETGYIVRPDYFKYHPLTGQEVDFITDYWKPHFVAYTQRIRSAHPEAIIFVQPPVFAKPPKFEEDDDCLQGRCAYSAHYYDGLTLVTRHWNWFNADALGLLRGKYSSPLQAVKVGSGAIRKSLQEQLALLQSDADILGPYPTIIGEIGTPFDMDGKKSYGWTDKGKFKGDYRNQEKALDASLNGCDGSNGLNYTIWTFCPDDHSHQWGDGWNMEDLSLWSPDDVWNDVQQQPGPLAPPKLRGTPAISSPSLDTLATTGSIGSLSTLGLKRFGHSLARNSPPNPYDFLTNGARAVRAFARPYPSKVVGKPLDVKFDIGKGLFRMVVTVGPEDRPEKGLATEVYIPLVHYAHPRLLVQGKASTPSTNKRPQLRRRKTSKLSNDARSTNSSTLSLSESIRERAQPSEDLEMANRSSDTEQGCIESGSSTSLLCDPSIPGPLSLSPPSPTPLLVDVEVKVSSGTWRVDGQTLFWWYDVPAEGEPPREYTIEVKRQGGVIKSTDVNRRRKGKKPRKLEEQDEKSWCERVCEPESVCVVM
ncbi:glycoside hydrolase family 5 protein [Laccaria bicolor S238N-H82]|uniref:Glycoside hydrolase family 5 protein n=1 Tax=Laccaria bicolor (strain S238N-H82 / ATCC MYA-4686) TaxID=486041 RepID=B0D2R1_LACBS|nr:glycoside hydrolase family 5 protein [Laccaria bicolor S238N-H82]EDR10797.1 glycoside hydrolase family 5 protein [Laccaria bicolor S238N-H82]|eukprot:XP_001878098.1 glycoside hydrolase family 5 protein [Laccaria bicolor S238N-H82]